MLNIKIIEILIGSDHDVAIKGRQFNQYIFISLQRQFFISIWSSINLTNNTPVGLMTNLNKDYFKLIIQIDS